MKSYRMNRLFHGTSGRCIDVAVDHGFFNEGRFLQGIENLESAVRVLVDAGPDAIQLTVGQADLLQRIPGKEKPALVLRTDVANVYGTTLPGVLFSKMIADPVGQAIRLDAACVVVNLFQIPGQAEVTAQCMDNILELKPACDEQGIPLMIEPLVFAPNEKDGGYMVDGDIDKILPLVRQAAELGADIIKADPTDPPEEYGRVIEAAGNVPVLVRGGGKVSDHEILKRTRVILEAGARGIVYGRNIIQHDDPRGMTQALMGLVHEGLEPEEALKRIGAGR